MSKKKFAHKVTKELLTESQIKEQKKVKGEYSPLWQGRINILDSEKSYVAKQMSISKKGEYAIKVR